MPPPLMRVWKEMRVVVFVFIHFFEGMCKNTQVGIWSPKERIVAISLVLLIQLIRCVQESRSLSPHHRQAHLPRIGG